jgi:hypothetical protein
VVPPLQVLTLPLWILGAILLATTAGLIDGMRWALIDGPSPGPQLAVSVGSLLLLLISGAAWFRTAERIFADTI